MTGAAFPADTVPTRSTWRSLLWILPVTVLWFVLIYWQPIIHSSGVPTTAVRLMTHGVIAVGLWLGLESTDMTPGQRRTTWLAAQPRCHARSCGLVSDDATDGPQLSDG
jgi:hypothetical protein